MIALSTSHHFAMGREAAAWVSSALEHTQTPVHWERVSDIIRKRGMERHGADMRYDDGDVRFIIKIPLTGRMNFMTCSLALHNAMLMAMLKSSLAVHGKNQGKRAILVYACRKPWECTLPVKPD
jgi:hypothetical protein